MFHYDSKKEFYTVLYKTMTAAHKNLWLLKFYYNHKTPADPCIRATLLFDKMILIISNDNNKKTF